MQVAVEVAGIASAGTGIVVVAAAASRWLENSRYNENVNTSNTNSHGGSSSGGDQAARAVTITKNGFLCSPGHCNMQSCRSHNAVFSLSLAAPR